jgi:hypothetical protein
VVGEKTASVSIAKGYPPEAGFGKSRGERV